MPGSRNRTDDNQGEIVDALRGVGAEWVPTTGDPRIGFDGLIAFRGRLYAAEIKDGSKPPSRRKLTDNERKRKAQLAAVGVDVLVIECVMDALRQIGAID